MGGNLLQLFCHLQVGLVVVSALGMKESPIVNTTDGQLRGTLDKDVYGEKFYSFLGIPYAKPPVGELRFKAPLPGEPWSGVRDATTEGNQCYQRIFLQSDYAGSEDCLFMNIFTRSLPKEYDALKPVMVWIHGGAYVLGSGSPTVYGPAFLMTADIVLVTVNYRLGVLGFLSLEDASLEVPGNAGLKDQVLALNWIHSNIKLFNGDPDSVTIFGESAGGSSGHFHVLSPLSKGLFHKAILQSGTALNPWPYSAPDANSFIKYLNKTAESEKELLEFLKDVPVHELVVAQNNFTKEKGTSLGIFGAVIESPHGGALISKNPIDIIKSGEYNHVPMIIGFNSEEGLIIELGNAIDNKLAGQPGPPPVKIRVEDYIPHQMKLEKGSGLWNTIRDKMSDFYFNGENRKDKYLVVGDGLFVAGSMAAVHNHAKTTNTPIYVYRFSVVAGRNFLRNLAGVKGEELGAGHADDTGYLFDSKASPQLVLGSFEEKAVRRLVKLWTNFAKYGDPTHDRDKDVDVEWKPVEQGHAYFLDIGRELNLSSNPEADRIEFWKELYHLSPNTESFL